ncbi:MAG: DEAD/DEAH box helicase [Phycisphaerae bacterium]|nr:DEAD/DEAH box helicase [Phycisphaerae bacterium]
MEPPFSWWNMSAATAHTPVVRNAKTLGGISVAPVQSAPFTAVRHLDTASIRLRFELERLKLLRGFDELLCLEGLHGVEEMPHQIDTVRKVLRYFHGRVLLADEVGLGKTIEAALLLREYLLRGMVKRVLILVPSPLTGRWRDELAGKFGLPFDLATSGWDSRHWEQSERVVASIALAKSRRHFDLCAAAPWDLVIVDEAHHCKNRDTRNWQLVNALRRRHIFLLTATPVQNNLIELYNLLTLLEPGHLKTEADFKKKFVTRGNPRDPRNRRVLRDLLSQVMVRNTRSLVNIELPRRYAQTFAITAGEDESRLYRHLDSYLRWRCRPASAATNPVDADTAEGLDTPDMEPQTDVLATIAGGVVYHPQEGQATVPESRLVAMEETWSHPPDNLPLLHKLQLNSILMAAGSHPLALRPALERLGLQDHRAAPLLELARGLEESAKEKKLLELLGKNRGQKTLVFANFRITLDRVAGLLERHGIRSVSFTGSLSQMEKELAIDDFKHDAPVMLCSDSGGEGFNLQFCNTLINFDLPWNPMRIEQRVGRVHRIGQTREVFVFNLCTRGSLEDKILTVLNDKLRMFELVVGEVGSILGNTENGEDFETLVLDLWMKSKSADDLDAAFANLGDALLTAQADYLKTKQLDDALFGEDYA